MPSYVQLGLSVILPQSDGSMTVNALADHRQSFSRSQHSGKRREFAEPLGLLAAVAQQREQFLKTFRRSLGPEDDLPPLLQPMRRGMAVSDPTINVLQRDAQQPRLPLQLVGDQFMQRFHRRQCKSAVTPKPDRFCEAAQLEGRRTGTSAFQFIIRSPVVR